MTGAKSFLHLPLNQSVGQRCKLALSSHLKLSLCLGPKVSFHRCRLECRREFDLPAGLGDDRAPEQPGACDTEMSNLAITVRRKVPRGIRVSTKIL